MALSGPLFDGRARQEMAAYLNDCRDTIALEYAITLVQELQRVVENPTPYYWTKIDVERRGNNAVVTDQGVVYGPWLAGVSRRNSTTRFKGYQHWRRATQRLRFRTPEIMVRLLRQRLPRIGGH
jgi:hypothetical protein